MSGTWNVARVRALGGRVRGASCCVLGSTCQRAARETRSLAYGIGFVAGGLSRASWMCGIRFVEWGCAAGSWECGLWNGFCRLRSGSVRLVAVPWAQDGGLWCSMGMCDPRWSGLTVGAGVGAPGSWDCGVRCVECAMRGGSVRCGIDPLGHAPGLKIRDRRGEYSESWTGFAIRVYATDCPDCGV